MTKGIFSSEFIMGLVGVILTYLNSALNWNVPVAEVLTVVGLIVTYIIGRTTYKVVGMKLGYGKKG